MEGKEIKVVKEDEVVIVETAIKGKELVELQEKNMDSDTMSDLHGVDSGNPMSAIAVDVKSVTSGSGLVSNLRESELTAFGVDVEHERMVRIMNIGVTDNAQLDKVNLKVLRTTTTVTAVRADMTSIQLHRQFELSDALSSYIMYVPGPRRIDQQTCCLMGPYAEFYRTSIDMFVADRSFVQHGYNIPFFCEKSMLSIKGNIPMSEVGVRDYGNVGTGCGLPLYFNGIVCVLARIMSDNTVLCNIPSVRPAGVAPVNFLKSVMLDKPGPSLVLAGEQNSVRWLRRYLRTFVNEGEDQFIYYYGRSSRDMDVGVNVKLLEYYSANVDQYYSGIVNLNARYLQSETDIQDHVERIIRAYGVRGLSFELPNLTGITPFNSFDIATATQVIFMSAFLQSNFVDLILEDNLRYFEECNIFTYDERFLLHSLEVKKPDQSILISFLVSRIDSCDFSYINYLMAMEVSPIFYICSSYPVSSNLTIEMSVVLLLEFYLFAITFPNSFDRIKGILQKTFYDIFNVLCPSEVLILLRTVGYVYSLDDAGRPVFDTLTGMHFINDTDYLIDRYPSLFSDLSQLHVPNIHSS